MFGGIGHHAGEPVDFTAGQRVRDVTVTAQRASVLAGLVRDADGRPVPGVVVGCREREPLDGWQGHDAHGRAIVTDRNGRFRAWVAPGTVAVDVPGLVGTQVVTVPAGGTRDLELVVGPVGR